MVISRLPSLKRLPVYQNHSQSDLLDVSTRQNIQMHWVQLEDVSEVFRGLVEVGLTSREACGNTIRNVMCSHFAGVCPNEPFDTTPYAKAIARFFLRNPILSESSQKI